VVQRQGVDTIEACRVVSRLTLAEGEGEGEVSWSWAQLHSTATPPCSLALADAVAPPNFLVLAPKLRASGC
jgi:hypothetical protein